MKSLKVILALLVTPMSLVACNSSNNDSHDPLLRVVHLSPDAPAVDISVNTDTPLTGVTYRQASSFLSVDEGSTNIKVLVAGTETAVIDAILLLEGDMKYTVIAAGFASSDADDALKIGPLVITDDIAAPSAGKAAITVVHGAPSAPAVDIYVTTPTADLPARSDATLTSVPFKTVSGELELDAGDYRVRITAENSRDVVYDSATITLDDGVEYVAIAADDTNSTALVGLTILTDLESTPFLTVDTNTASKQ